MKATVLMFRENIQNLEGEKEVNDLITHLNVNDRDPLELVFERMLDIDEAELQSGSFPKVLAIKYLDQNGCNAVDQDLFENLVSWLIAKIKNQYKQGVRIEKVLRYFLPDAVLALLSTPIHFLAFIETESDANHAFRKMIERDSIFGLSEKAQRGKEHYTAALVRRYYHPHRSIFDNESIDHYLIILDQLNEIYEDPSCKERTEWITNHFKKLQSFTLV